MPTVVRKTYKSLFHNLISSLKSFTKIRFKKKDITLKWNIKECKDSPLSWLVEILELRKGLIYLSCIEGKGGGKDIHYSAQNAALFVDLL